MLTVLFLNFLTARHNSSLVEVNGGFGEMVSSTQKYYVFGGKGGVGKTSLAASLAVKFANHGEPTLIVSMHPAHSLGDTLEQVSELLCYIIKDASGVNSLAFLLNILLVLSIGPEWR
jgi:arsenite-transporting ATPase